MDPISQGAVGAAFAQSTAQRARIRAYALFGALAGMAPDLDVLIQSPTDPLLFLEYHRHFTHALLFIPCGALVVCAVLYRLLPHPLRWREAYLACLVGYATHGLLDACTSYGTQLFWPFTDVRVAWNNVSVVDPLATLPLLVCVIMASLRRRRVWAIAGVSWLCFYLLLGVVQRERAMDSARALAVSRGHVAERLTVKPGFANLLLWKSIYAANGLYYVDGIRAGLPSTVCPGAAVQPFQYAAHAPDLVRTTQQATDIERFRWFSDDWLAISSDGFEIGDIRYSMVPNQIDPLWTIRMDPRADTDAHVDFVSHRRVSGEQTRALLALMVGDACTELPPAETPS